MKVMLAVFCLLLFFGGGTDPASAEPGANRSASFVLNGLWPLAESLGGVDRLIGIDFAYRFEIRRYFLLGRFGMRSGGSLDADGHSALDVSMLDVRAGRYLSGGSVAPFVHAGAGAHWCRAEQNIATGLASRPIMTVQGKKAGLSLIAGGGLTAFRTSRLELQVMVEYVVTLADLDPSGMPRGILCSVSVWRGAGTE